MAADPVLFVPPATPERQASALVLQRVVRGLLGRRTALNAKIRHIVMRAQIAENASADAAHERAEYKRLVVKFGGQDAFCEKMAEVVLTREDINAYTPNSNKRLSNGIEEFVDEILTMNQIPVSGRKSASARNFNNWARPRAKPKAQKPKKQKAADPALQAELEATRAQLEKAQREKAALQAQLDAYKQRMETPQIANEPHKDETEDLETVRRIRVETRRSVRQRDGSHEDEQEMRKKRLKVVMEEWKSNPKLNAAQRKACQLRAEALSLDIGR
jgi:hypothetical protein